MYPSFDGDVVEKIFASDKDDIGNVTNSFNLEKNYSSWNFKNSGGLYY